MDLAVGDAALPAKPKHGIQRMTKGNGMEMVLHATCNEGEGLPAWGDRPEGVESPLSASKRRTKRLQFTCNKCQQRTTRAVNPHALKSGTVFVQCSHCLVHHKIVDHLNLFEDAQVRASYIHPPFTYATTAGGSRLVDRLSAAYIGMHTRCSAGRGGRARLGQVKCTRGLGVDAAGPMLGG